MPDPIDFLPARDLLGHSAPLAWRAIFPVLGVPIEYRTNSDSALARVTATLGHWRALDPALHRPGPPRSITLVVHRPWPSDPPEEPRQAMSYRVHGPIQLAASGPNLMMADSAQGQATAFVTPTLVADDLHFRYNVVESLALALTRGQDRVAVHAAGVVRHGRSVLLFGPSRSGKSTLCYASLQAGFDLLAEDVVFVSRAPTLRLWGGATRLHLLPDAPRFFPELAAIPPQVQANGKLKLAVELPPERVRLQASAATLCLVTRGEGEESTLEPLDRAAAAAHLCEGLESGFDILADQMPAVAEALTRTPPYRLRVGRDLDDAVACLRRLTDGD